MLFHVNCKNCTDKEKQIKELFKTKYGLATLYGSEYFIGDYCEMQEDIMKITQVDKKLNNQYNKKVYDELTKKLNKKLQQKTQHKNDNQVIPNIIQPSKIQHLIDNKEITLIVNTTPENIQQNIKVPLKNQQLINNEEITFNIESKTENQDEYKCLQCDNIYKTKNGLQKHMRTNHTVNNKIEQKKQHICKFCNTGFRTRQTKWSHEQKCKNINNMPLADQVKNLTAEIKELKSNSNSKINIDV